MDNQGELHKNFVIVFEKAWNANLYKCIIQEQLWALFKLRNVYFVLSKLQLNCYKRARVRHNYDQGRFHIKSKRGRTHRLNLHDHKCTCGKILIYGFPCSHIIAACQFLSVDFQSFFQGYYSTELYYDTWATLFHPIFDEYEWPPYEGPTIVPSESMKRTSCGHPKSIRLHNEMDVRKGKTTITSAFCKQLGHNPRSCRNRNKVD